jgi:hypothetical protein
MTQPVVIERSAENQRTQSKSDLLGKPREFGKTL